MAQTIQVDANITKASFGTRGLTCFAAFYMEYLCDTEITCDIRASCTAYACNPRYVLSLKCKEDDAAWLSPGLSLTKKRAYATRFQRQNNARATNSTNKKKRELARAFSIHADPTCITAYRGGLMGSVRLKPVYRTMHGVFQHVT
jgi:hypothetical protein